MTPWVARLLWANVIVFLLQNLLPQVTYLLAYQPAAVLVRPWTPVTYMFVHGGLGHIFFNMLALFFFGPRVEARLGPGSFLRLYLLSGLVGALLSFFFTPAAFIVGASGAVFGVMMAFAYYWPREHIYIWGVLPVEARWLVIITTAIALLGGFTGRGGGVAHFAHLGGYLGGFLYLKWLERRSPARRFRRQAAPPPRRTDGGDVRRWARIRRDELHEVNRQEVDRILDKISAQGVASLTPAERETLERFSAQQNLS
jgi:membrane associated rhomboid family serine protease